MDWKTLQLCEMTLAIYAEEMSEKEAKEIEAFMVEKLSSPVTGRIYGSQVEVRDHEVDENGDVILAVCCEIPVSISPGSSGSMWEPPCDPTVNDSVSTTELINEIEKILKTCPCVQGMEYEPDIECVDGGAESDEEILERAAEEDQAARERAEEYSYEYYED